MIWFTADWHLWHSNIIRYSNRPFKDVDEMNKVIQDNINAVVRPKDHLVVLGDLSWKIAGNGLAEWLDGLNCKNISITWGNHDRAAEALHKKEPGRFTVAEHMIELKENGHRIVGCHYALRTWNRSHQGAYHVYGHSHGTLPEDSNARSMDVGVDCHDFKPLSFDQVKAVLDQRNWKPVDYHGAD